MPEYADILTGEVIKDDKAPFGFFIRTKKVKLPEGWKQTCIACPIQYEKVVKIGNKYYVGYLRSRWGNMFSIQIYETNEKGFPWGDLVFEHRPIETEYDNPPFKSMEIIDRQFRKMRKEVGN